MSGTTLNDGGPATNAALNAPTGIAFDKTGNLYIVDSYEHTIRQVNPGGINTTIAGTGTAGFGGDGGAAMQARFSEPSGIAIDGTGALYVADKLNNRVRKIAANGIISTVAGNGQYGYTGDGGPATSGQLAYPTDVALTASGDLLIVDSGNSKIRKVSTNGVMTTVAGNGVNGFGGDGGLAVNASFKLAGGIAIDAAGNVFVADTYNNRIRRIDIAGTVTTVAGNGASGFSGDGGLATQASMQEPLFLTFDAAGVLYITQSDNRVRRVGTDGIISSLAGTGFADFTGDGGPATQAALSNPAGIVIGANGAIYVADRENYRVRVITGGSITTAAGGYTGDGRAAYIRLKRGPEANPATTGTPVNIGVDGKGNLYVVDRYRDKIRKVAPDRTVSTVAGTGIRGYSGDGGLATQAKLATIRGVNFDRANNLYVVDQINTRIRKVDANGIIMTTAGDGQANFIDKVFYFSSADFGNSTTLPIDSAGNLYAFSSCCVLKVNPAGVISIVAGTTAGTGFSGDGGPATNARLSYPNSAVFGENNTLYIADGYNNRIRKVGANGIITTIAGTGSTGLGAENVAAVNTPIMPTCIARDAAGNLYVAETSYPRVRKIDRNGIVSTIAGSSAKGNSGDGGLATEARLGLLKEIILDAAGNLYIADAENRNVRKVTYPIQAGLKATSSWSGTSVTLTATPAGYGFTYQFGPGATQIGSTNQAVVTMAGTYSVTVSTSVFGSPAGTATLSVVDSEIYTLRNGSWNDPGVWSSGVIPGAEQRVRIGHSIDIPGSYQATVGNIRYIGGGSVRFGQQGRLTLTE